MSIRLAAALCLVSLTVAPVDVGAQPVGAVDWPMARHDAAGTGRVIVTQPGAPRVKSWRFEAGSHVWGYQPGMSVWSSPAVGVVQGEATVFVGSYDKNVYALSAVSGEQQWRFTTGAGIYSAPALWRGDGQSGPLLFVASSDRLLYALDAGLGRRRWIHTVKAWRPTMGGARLSAPCVGRAGDKAAVFVGHWVWDKSLSGHMQAAGMSAVDALTGEALWRTDLGDNRVYSPVCATVGRATVGGDWRVFVGSENGNLYALDALTGRLLWSYTDREAVMGTPAVWTDPVGGGTRVFFGSKYGRVRSLDARTGKELWRQATSHWVDGSPLITRTAAGRPLVLVGSYDTHFYALDALTGARVWDHQVAGGVYSGAALATTAKGGVRVLFSAWDHHLHCLNLEDGSLAWSAFTGRPIWDSLTLGDSAWSSPAVAEINGQAVAYTGSYAGPFYAIPLAEAEGEALARPGSNLRFWVTLPLVMLGTALLAVWLTRRSRRRQRASSRPTTLP